ncbi:MAG: Multi-sensor signal transduction histidine kinase [Pedosphaera sp.]|nr:Multi-sensor signal transduction histidine kinase [Pedosphaera sp.]
MFSEGMASYWGCEVKLKFSSLITGSFLLAIMLLIVLGGVAYLSITGLIQAADAVSHTHEVLENLNGLLSELSDAEVGERGYIITGNESFLEPYNGAAAKVDAQLKTLVVLTADNPAQQERLAKLMQLTGKKLEVVNKGIALRRDNGFEPAAAEVRTQEGKRVMDEVRGVIATMVGEEKSLLAARDRRARTRAGIAVPFSLIGDIVSLLLLAGVFYLLKQEIANQRRAKQEIRALNQSLEEHAGQLETANKELEAFSYSVSHDLRAPLRHISGFVDLLGKHEGMGKDEKAARYLKFISDSARRMGALVDDLLAFSRMGRTDMRLTQVNLTEMVVEVGGELAGACRGRSIEWRFSALPVVQADPAMLRLVLVNLLANAIKYTGTRSQAKIEMGHQPGEAEDVIYVRDNGVGFNMKYIDKLFGVFQRLHHADEFEGTGIGLANVRRIIGRHGGRTWAEGAEGQGATFYFSLPKQANHKPTGNQS